MSDNIDIHPRRKPPTPEQIIAEQKRRATASKVAARSHQAPPSAPKAAPANATPPVNNVPAVAKAGMLATTALDTRTAEQRYVDEISPSMIAGQMVKFGKDGTFVVAETEEEISPDIDLVALCDETLIGWIRFRDDGEQPDRIQGLLYDGFRHAGAQYAWRPGREHLEAGLVRSARRPLEAPNLSSAAKSDDGGALHFRHNVDNRTQSGGKFVAPL